MFQPLTTFPADARIVEIVDGYVVTSGDTIQVWELDGTLVSTIDGAATGLAGADVGGARTLLACTPEGLIASGFVLPAPELLDPEPCVAVRATPDGFATLGATARRWTSVDVQALPLSGSLLAVHEDLVVVASPGDTVIQLDDGTTLEAGGALGDLCGDGWTLPGADQLVPWGGEPVDVAAAPGLVRGLRDGRLVVTHAASFGVWDGAEEVTSTTVTALATSDDACGLIATTDGENVTIWSDPTCVDADGDGYAARIDCDDGSAAVHPGAEDVCDGVDNNCDGTVDGPVTITFWTTPLADWPDADQEGGSMGIEAEGLCGDLTWTLGGDRAGDCLELPDHTLRCDWTDNGTLDVLAETVGGRGTRTYTIENVEPDTIGDELCPCSCDACPVGDVRGEPGAQVVKALATDMPGDNLLCSLSEPVPGVVLDGCIATWDVPSEGSWPVDLTAWDKDGASVTRGITFVGAVESEGAFCAPVGARSWLGIAAALSLLRRRTR